MDVSRLDYWSRRAVRAIERMELVYVTAEEFRELETFAGRSVLPGERATLHGVLVVVDERQANRQRQDAPE